MENKYVIFDTHAHYDDEAFDEDRESVFKQIKENGVIGILNCASSYESISKANKLTLENDFIYGALGIHPENANEFNDDVEKEILDLVEKNKKIIAIGEIGLDYYWDENPSKDIQKKVFRQQMKLAEKLNLPVVIHDREAHGDTLEIIKEFPNVKGIVNTDIIINGQLSNPNYSLNMSSSEVSIKNFKINDIVLNLAGDKEKANLNKLSLDVYKNLIVGSGNYDIKNKTYNVNMRSNNKIDLSRFQTFFNSYGINNPSGKIGFNVQIDQNDEKAYLSLENINLESSKLKLKFSNFSGPITLSGRRIEIGELNAKLNNSPITIDGFVDLVDIAKIDKEDIIRSLPYKLHIKSKELNYVYPEVIKLKASTDITLTNEELYGNLIIKEATINDIPNN